MKTATVKPAPGRETFRQPENNFRPMPAAGVQVVLTPFYNRALHVGDLVLVHTAAETEATAELAGLAKAHQSMEQE